MLHIRISTVVRCLAATICILLFASITSTILIRAGIRPNGNRWFDVNLETNLPACFSTLQLFFAAILLGVIAFAERARHSIFSRHWFLLAAGFIVLSADEMLSFHERLVDPIRALLGAGRSLGVFYYAWVLPALLLISALAVFFFRFVFHLPASTRRDFLIAAALFLGGAVGMEMLNGWQHEVDSQKLGRVSQHLWEMSPSYLVLTTIEEGLEMTGILYFIRALLLHMARTYSELKVAFVPATRRGKDEERPE